MIGVAFWSLHLGMTQGVLALWSQTRRLPTLRGTAFGAFNFVSGGALLMASLIAGVLS